MRSPREQPPGPHWHLSTQIFFVEIRQTTDLSDSPTTRLAQRGIASSANRPGPYSNREDQFWQMDRLILERLGDS